MPGLPRCNSTNRQANPSNSTRSAFPARAQDLIRPSHRTSYSGTCHESSRFDPACRQLGGPDLRHARAGPDHRRTRGPGGQACRGLGLGHPDPLHGRLGQAGRRFQPLRQRQVAGHLRDSGRSQHLRLVRRTGRPVRSPDEGNHRGNRQGPAQAGQRRGADRRRVQCLHEHRCHREGGPDAGPADPEPDQGRPHHCRSGQAVRHAGHPLARGHGGFARCQGQPGQRALCQPGPAWPARPRLLPGRQSPQPGDRHQVQGIPDLRGGRTGLWRSGRNGQHDLRA